MANVTSQQPQAQDSDGISSDDDRRSNGMLRTLIDEMLDRVRELNRNTGIWSAEDRARAEAELESIMARVRRVAAQNHAT